MLRMYRIKKALTIAFIVALVLVVLFMIYSYMKESAALDGYEFNPFHTKHDYYYETDPYGHTKVYTCGCYNFNISYPHKFYEKTYDYGIKKRLCEICGFGY